MIYAIGIVYRVLHQVTLDVFDLKVPHCDTDRETINPLKPQTDNRYGQHVVSPNLKPEPLN